MKILKASDWFKKQNGLETINGGDVEVLEVKKETEKALLVKVTYWAMYGKGPEHVEREMWLPKSQIEIVEKFEEETTEAGNKKTNKPLISVLEDLKKEGYTTVKHFCVDAEKAREEISITECIEIAEKDADKFYILPIYATYTDGENRYGNKLFLNKEFKENTVEINRIENNGTIEVMPIMEVK